MAAPPPFKIDIPQQRLDAIMARVRDYEWFEAPEGGGWAYGVDPEYLRELCAYWTEAFEWRAAEAGLNRFPQYTAPVEVEGETLPLHFLHERSSGPDPVPLILLHGWPGSFFEFLHVVERLAHPGRFGEEGRGFHVVVPSLIGYGFSGKPKRPIGPRRQAAYFGKLMSEVLGYDGYIAQGGDWGAMISAYLGLDAPACRAVHLNMPGWQSPGVTPQSKAEEEHAAASRAMFEAEGAYFRVQSTKPLSLASAMMDSPVGTAAWIVEKFHGWSDLENGEIESAYTKDQLLTNVMIYLVTRTFNTASWLYRGLFEDGYGSPLAPGTRLEKPTSCAVFPHDFIKWPPRSQVERSYNVTRWTEMETGGHFAALERPDAFIGDVRAFADELG
ncbi:MAG: epoxide hydrolase family protein [Alphaproteobacteria bacterium]